MWRALGHFLEAMGKSAQGLGRLAIERSIGFPEGKLCKFRVVCRVLQLCWSRHGKPQLSAAEFSSPSVSVVPRYVRYRTLLTRPIWLRSIRRFLKNRRHDGLRHFAQSLAPAGKRMRRAKMRLFIPRSPRALRPIQPVAVRRHGHWIV
jgi:hypothetical protein